MTVFLSTHVLLTEISTVSMGKMVTSLDGNKENTYWCTLEVTSTDTGIVGSG